MARSGSSPKFFFFNPLFDLELGGYPIDTVAASARQMSPLFALMGTSQDRILLDVNVPDAYWEYLDHNGIDHALPPGKREDLAGFEAVPWGWNESSLERLTRAGARCDHPPIETVRAVNGRAWCAAFNADTGTGVPGTRFCADEQEFNRVLEDLEGSYPQVVKPAFGASGYGFVRMRDATGFSPDQRRAIGGLIARGGCVAARPRRPLRAGLPGL